MIRGSLLRLSVALFAIVVCAVACRSVPPLAHTYDSPESLATALVDALARNDRAALEALALDRQEFTDHVWPDLPAAKPERNLPVSYVWGDLRQKSQTGLATTLAAYGGRRYSLERVVLTGRTAYRRYRIHRDTTLYVRDESGAKAAIRVCGSLLEQRGRWKVFSYVVDN